MNVSKCELVGKMMPEVKSARIVRKIEKRYLLHVTHSVVFYIQIMRDTPAL
jgi:hypothetical protein